jgi:hypothetical protein
LTWARSTGSACFAGGLLSGALELGAVDVGAAELLGGGGASEVDGADGAAEVGVGSSARAGAANPPVSKAAAASMAKERATDLALLDLFTNSHP